MQSKSFTTANDGPALTDYGAVCEGESPSKMAQHIARFFATSEDSSGSAAIELALVKGGAAIARFTGTATVTARRANTAGTGGAYICDVVWSETGNSKFDLLGMTNAPGGGAGNASVSGAADQGYQWLVGVTAFTTINDLILYWQTTSVT